jgi:hypothetical protein
MCNQESDSCKGEVLSSNFSSTQKKLQFEEDEGGRGEEEFIMYTGI